MVKEREDEWGRETLGERERERERKGRKEGRWMDWAMYRSECRVVVVRWLTECVCCSFPGPTRSSSTSGRTGLWWFRCGLNWTRKIAPSSSWVLSMGSIDSVSPGLLFLCPVPGLQLLRAQRWCQIAETTQEGIGHRFSSAWVSAKRSPISWICWSIPYVGYRRSRMVHGPVVSIAPLLPLLFGWPFTIPVPTLSPGQVIVCFKCWPPIPPIGVVYGSRISETWAGVDSTFNDWRWNGGHHLGSRSKLCAKSGPRFKEVSGPTRASVYCPSMYSTRKSFLSSGSTWLFYFLSMSSPSFSGCGDRSVAIDWRTFDFVSGEQDWFPWPRLVD